MNIIRGGISNSNECKIVHIDEYDGFNEEDFEEIEPEIATIEVTRKNDKTKFFHKYTEILEKLLEKHSDLAFDEEKDTHDKNLIFSTDIKFQLKPEESIGTNVYFQRLKHPKLRKFEENVKQRKSKQTVEFIGATNEKLSIELSQNEAQLNVFIKADSEPQNTVESGPENQDRNFPRLESIFDPNLDQLSVQDQQSFQKRKKLKKKNKYEEDEEYISAMPKLGFNAKDINEYIKRTSERTKQKSKDKSHTKATFILKRIDNERHVESSNINNSDNQNQSS